MSKNKYFYSRGFLKLTAYANKKLKINSLVSYTDLRYFKGSGYKGKWQLIERNKPQYYYMNNYKYRENRMKYQKRELLKLFPDFYEETLTEWQIMQLAGYDRIWDCGTLVYSYDTNNKSMDS